MKPSTKQADWANHIPAYAGLGGGAFALGALLNEVRRQRESEAQRNRQELPQNALVIDIPRTPGQVAPKTAATKVAFLENLVDHSLSAAVGAPAGFLGAKVLYDKYKKNQTDKEIADANRKYLATLQAMRQKSAELNTPLVDQFCKSAAETMNKEASGLTKALPWLIGGGTAAGLGYDAMRDNPGGVAGGSGDLLKKLFYSTAILSGLGLAGAMVHANSKREAKGPATPSAVALNYEDIPPAATLQQ